jgi:hypothetical protein
MMRTPLSGRGGGAGTSGDCYAAVGASRSKLYVEVKHYARAFIFSLFKDTETKAARERRTPIVVMHEKGTQRYVAAIDLELLCYLLDKVDGDGTGSLFGEKG